MKTIFTSFLVIFMLSFSFAADRDTTLNATAEITNESTQGAANGAIDLTVTGGTSPYSFSWSNDADTEDIDNLSAGTYDVTIYDADSASVSYSYDVNIEQTEGDSTETDSTSNPCDNFYGEIYVDNATQGNNNGAIYLNISGGTSPYTYAWNTGATTRDIDGLAPGHYTVDVADSNDCAFSLSAYVYEASGDSSGNQEPVDTVETEEPVDTCFNNPIDHVVINSYVISGDYVETSWLVFDADDNLMGTFTASYYMTNDSAAYYQFVIRFECNRSRATSSKFSYPLYIDRGVVASVQTISNNSSEINIYPNPVNNTAFVNIDAQQSTDAQITIVSVTGQLISTQNVSLNIGKNVVGINTSSLKQGTYILRLTRNNQVTIKRFMK